MSEFREDDQASYMSLFYKTPIGRKWLKEQAELIKEQKRKGNWKNPKAVGMLLPIDETVTRLVFEDNE